MSAGTVRPVRGMGGSGLGSDGFGSGYGGGNGDSGGPLRAPAPGDTHRLGMFFALTGVSMLFVALTSAYIVRMGASDDWRPLRMPGLVWVNTAVLLLSSLVLEKARQSLKNTGAAAVRRWVTLTLLLGAVFLAGQWEVWRLLAGQGIYLSSNPHSSFFYTLTGLHGLHVLGGIAALLYIAVRARRQRLERWIDGAALYWHFMGGLWVYLAALLFVRT